MHFGLKLALEKHFTYSVLKNNILNVNDFKFKFHITIPLSDSKC